MGQAHARAGVMQGDGEKAELSTLDSVSVTPVRGSAVIRWAETGVSQSLSDSWTNLPLPLIGRSSGSPGCGDKVHVSFRLYSVLS